jgi:hypothetical protein
MEVDEKDDANSSDGSTHSLESTAETANDDASTTAGDGQDVKNQKPEYPMDAVLTLMQLNAGKLNNHGTERSLTIRMLLGWKK